MANVDNENTDDVKVKKKKLIKAFSVAKAAQEAASSAYLEAIQNGMRSSYAELKAAHAQALQSRIRALHALSAADNEEEHAAGLARAAEAVAWVQKNKGK